MINVKHLLKTASAWISIVYSIYFFGTVIYLATHYSLPANFNFMYYGLLGLFYFVLSLVIWNIVALFGAWLFATLFNNTESHSAEE